MPATKDLENVESCKDVVKESSNAAEQSTENGSCSSEKKVTTAEGQNKTDDDKEKMVTEAGTLLAQGKRHLFVKDYPLAVASLGDACSKFSEIYGELAYECADAYFNYGSALLELAREESGVLDVDNKDKDSEGSDEGSGEKESVGEEEKDVDDKDKAEEENAEDGKIENGSECNKSLEEKNENADEEEEEDDDDVNNLQLSWEIFELAKRSYQQQNDELKLAETYLKLGEVALESENYDGAITDIQHCLDLQKKILPPVSREIAETHFQMGIAFSLSNGFDQAIEHFRLASELLENRVQNLSKMTEPEPEKAKNPFYTIQNEIEEIKALLPEIKEKIIDMEEFKKETMKVVQETFGVGSSKKPSDGAGSSTNGASSSSAVSKGPVNDISHLVRKKRKPEDSNETESKKQHLETKTT